jgi:hypothetical protein
MKAKTKSLKQSTKVPTELHESELSRVFGGLNMPIFDSPSPASSVNVHLPQGFNGNVLT